MEFKMDVDFDKRVLNYINKRKLCKMLSKKTGYFQTDIEKIMNALGETVDDLLVQTKENEITEIKIFDGLKVRGEYVDEHEKVNNCISDSPIMVASNVKLSSSISHGYKSKVRKKYVNKDAETDV